MDRYSLLKSKWAATKFYLTRYKIKLRACIFGKKNKSAFFYVDNKLDLRRCMGHVNIDKIYSKLNKNTLIVKKGHEFISDKKHLYLLCNHMGR